jgi:hypothetical protein
MSRDTGGKKEEICQEKMVPVRPEEEGVAVWEQDVEWVQAPAWGPVGFVYAQNVATKAPILEESLAIQ